MCSSTLNWRLAALVSWALATASKFASPQTGSDHTPREAFFAIAQEAPRLGLRFAGHVPIGVKVEETAEAGIRSIEHLSNYDVFVECLVDDQYTAAGL
jgi:hypothetical protein